MTYLSPGERRRQAETERNHASKSNAQQEARLKGESLARINFALGRLASQNKAGDHWMEIARPVGKIASFFEDKDNLIDGLRLNTGRLYHEHPAYWKVVERVPVWVLPHVYTYKHKSNHPKDEGYESTSYESYAINQSLQVMTNSTRQGYEEPYDGRVANMESGVLIVAEHAIKPHQALSPQSAHAIANALEAK